MKREIDRPHGELSDLVRSLLPGRDTGDVHRMIEERWRRELSAQERRTIIEMASRLRTWGTTQHIADLAAPTAPVCSHFSIDERKVVEDVGAQRMITSHEAQRRCMLWIMDEDLWGFVPMLRGGLT